MLLKRLELQGFKSFADKTVLDFMDGTTGVVGPNGSGKSNISDAIRWVIGETSAKTLRGSNMQDVIFAGTATRKGVNYAEVSLVLDNSNHDFNVDFDEVIVTRRLFRSGESVYQINRSNCRLKDVHELFMDTGLGRDGYSMIGQGSVSQILSTKAEDRRSIFEEASGVSKYRYKKEEAVRKLAQVDDNLVRIGDISAELETQIGPLARQSEKARKYMTLYGDMKQLDISLSVIALERNKADEAKARQLYADVESELEDVHSKESENEKLMNALYEENRSSDEEKTRINAELIENEAGISATENEINIFENNIKNSIRNSEQLKQECERINKKNEERVALIKEQEKSIEEKTEQIKEISSGLYGSRSAVEEYEHNIKGIDDSITRLRKEYFERENEIASGSERARGIDNLRSSFIERREAVNAEIKSYKEGVESTKTQIDEAKAAIFEKEDKLKSMSETVSRLEEEKKTAEESLSKLNEKVSASKVEYNSKQSKKRILEGLENDYAGYAKSVKAVLTAKELKGLSIYGTISGLVDLDKRYVTAIETALGGALQNIVVESEEDAKAAIEFLRRTRGGRATFLPVTSVKGRVLDNAAQVSKSKGFIGIAAELITCDRKYSGIINSLLGRVVVVDNIDNAIALSRSFGYKFKTVTLEGDVLNAGGSLSGGSVNKQSGFLSRATEIKSLSAEISSLSQILRESEKNKMSLEADISRADSQLSSFVPLVREYEDDILKLKNTCRMLEESLVQGDSESYERELLQIEEQLKETAEETAKIIAQVTSLKTKNKTVESEIAKMSEEREEIVSRKNEVSEQSAEISERIAELNKDVAVSRQTIASAYAEIGHSKDELARRRTEIDENSASVEKYKLGIAQKQEELSGARALSDEMRVQLKSLDERKREISEKMQSYRTDNKDITGRIIELQKELSRAENRCSKLESERESTLNRLWDDYELTFNDAAEQKKDIENIKEATEELVSLKKKIKSLGSVNLDSIEEYKSVKERFEFMTKQKADLERSKDNLVRIIDSMEELMKEQFKEQFGEINKAFKEVFTELFGGGIGKLSLSDPDNILTSGIEIEVQLPGKSSQNINLYSGGEKSFIAIALLFAILRVKPTPFCILDEIDAALDDVNVSRFATYLKNYTDRTQFIVITHRRGTMEAASVLYGVTMQESGVSKLLSLKIDDVADDLIQ